MLEFNLRDRVIKTSLPAFIVGVINATPDSFYPNSRVTKENVLKKVSRYIEEGASIIDIGAESSRPGSAYITEEEERKRLLPLVKKIRSKFNIPLSIDTRRAGVFQEAFDCGADILNDISALEDDKAMAKTVATLDTPVILMHKRGLPSTMKSLESYEDVVEEVKTYLTNRCNYALSEGIKKERIIVDPGVGFAKKASDNLRLLAQCGKLCGGEYKVLVGTSRKSFIKEFCKIDDNISRESSEYLTGSVVTSLIAVQNGATFIRTHDIKEHNVMLKLLARLGK